MRTLHRPAWVALAVALTSMAGQAMACPVCFGDPDAAMIKGMNAGILVLLGVIGLVQVGFIALFVSFWRRAKRMRPPRERFRLIDGGIR